MGGLDETGNGTTLITIAITDFVNDLLDEIHVTAAAARHITSA